MLKSKQESLFALERKELKLKKFIEGF